MVLIYNGMTTDPRVARLDASAAMTWVAAVATCNRLRRETVAVDEVAETRARGTDGLEHAINEMERSELAERLPHGHLRLLARGDLWEFEDTDEA